jgi:flagellar basal-body rod protein FlgC
MADFLYGVMRTISSGLTAQRKKMEAVASNIANSETTRAEGGGPYRRKSVVVKEATFARTMNLPTVRLTTRLAATSPMHIQEARLASERFGISEEPVMESQEIEAGPEDVKMIYDPQHPDANEKGYVAYPDVNPLEEMVDMMTATRAYEANVTAMEAFKAMVQKALEI